jgi:NADH-quinone oxidoreductase subunit L
MYQAIVFLPLLGAIVAGLIALAGARGRHPGGAAHAGHDTGAGHAATTDAAHGGAVHVDAAHGDTVHAGAGHGEHVVEPAAAGSRPAELITTVFLFIAMILSWIAFARVGFGQEERVQIFTWIAVGDLRADWALRVDTLTAVMLVVVTSISSIVHLYSIGYMEDDPHRPRFFCYLSLFTFAMLMLVTSDNLVQLFFGWEGVGLMSYLLVGFWFHKPSANAAAIKAFVVNRVGDFGFALGIFATFMMTGAVDFSTVFAQAPAMVGKTIHIFAWDFDALTLICVLLFTGAMGKSAQFMLHTWLPDAMEGPTPVSALIHAATMVTAGVFMVARLSPLFELAPSAQSFVIVIGATTAFFAATVGLVQNDIKRIVAYSTCSQLGYMFVAMGAGAYSVGMFHLFTHAFFKALLFLGSGSVILAMHHEQDIRHMGGLKDKIPFTYAMMLVGTLALTGFPLTAGYFSKDAIIEAAYATRNPWMFYAFTATVVAAALTSFYSWRLIFLTFHGRPHNREHYDHARENGWVIGVPLALLAWGSILAGYPFKELFAGTGVEAFFRGSLTFGINNRILEDMHHVPLWVVVLPTVMMVLGFLVAWLFYIRRPDLPAELARQHEPLYNFLLNKWYIDELYELVFVRPALWIGRLFWKQGDGRVIDGLGPDGVSARVLDVTQNVVKLQSGYLYHYAFAMLIGVAALITWFIIAAGGIGGW